MSRMSRTALLSVGVVTSAFAVFAVRACRDVDPVSGYPRKWPNEYHAPFAPDGPWLAVNMNALERELICQNGARVPLCRANAYIESSTKSVYACLRELRESDFPVFMTWPNEEAKKVYR